jgi:hypothetical protein
VPSTKQQQSVSPNSDIIIAIIGGQIPLCLLIKGLNYFTVGSLAMESVQIIQ